MEEASKLHRDTPYGWVLVAGALWRLVARRRRARVGRVDSLRVKTS